MNKLALRAASAAIALLLCVSALPPQYADITSTAITAEARTYYDMPSRITDSSSTVTACPAGSGKLRLSWVGSEDKYYGIYEGNTSKLLYYVKGTSLLISGLTNGRSVSYSVYEAAKTRWGYDRIKYVGFVSDNASSLTAPGGLKSEKEYKGTFFKWNKVKGASGYIIYLKRSYESKLTYYKTVSSPKVAVYGIPGDWFELRIIPIRTSGTNTEYGADLYFKSTLKSGGNYAEIEYCDLSNKIYYNNALLYTGDVNVINVRLFNRDAERMINDYMTYDARFYREPVEFENTTAGIRDFYSYCGGKSNSRQTYKCYVAANTPSMVSIRNEITTHNNNARGSIYSEYCYNFDTNTGNLMLFDDVFLRDEFVENCESIINARARANGAYRKFSFAEYLEQCDTDERDYANSLYYFSGGKLVLLLSPFNSKTVKVVLDYREFNHYLTEYGRRMCNETAA